MLRYALITLLLFLPLVQEKKESKIDGWLCCAKCTTKKSSTCKNYIEWYQHKNGYSRTMRYYLDDNGSEEHYHGKGMRPASVTGIIVERNKVIYIIPSKVRVAGDEEKP